MFVAVQVAMDEEPTGMIADPKAVNREGKTTADMANAPVQRVQPWPEAFALLEKLGGGEQPPLRVVLTR